ncbi:MAG: 16S rRNA (uracil(1498)-N(3))-methyltransferase [Candidatus Eisenbacteria bacterium]
MTRTGRFEESFFVAPEGIGEEEIEISGTEARHISVVLRRRPGDLLAVVDGRGGRYKAEIAEADPGRVTARITHRERVECPKPEIWLGLALIRTSRMDTAVEKCCELGARVIAPLRTRRSLSAKGVSEQRVARWQRLAVSALTQSSGAFLAEVQRPSSLQEFLERAGRDSKVFLADPSGKPMHAVRASELEGPRIAGCVGPEGGFCPEEIELLLRFGAVPVSLGPRRLRTETAAMCLLDRLMCLTEGPKPGED